MAPRRIRLHQHIARVLEEVLARRLDEHAAELAARQLERALVVQDLVDPDDPAQRCDLLLELGEVLLPAGETERVITHLAPDAFALAEALDDRGRAFAPAVSRWTGSTHRGYRSAAFLPEYLGWAERAANFADPDSVEHVHADLALANAWHVRGRLREARALRLAALALARRLGDAETLFRSAYDVFRETAPQHSAEAMRLSLCRLFGYRASPPYQPVS